MTRSNLFLLSLVLGLSTLTRVIAESEASGIDLPCIDSAPEGTLQCQTWAAIGECDKNPGYMAHSCRKSCGLCVSSSDEEDNEEEKEDVCVDLAHEGELQCREWAWHGECERNPVFMESQCRKSCKLCPSQVHPVQMPACEDAYDECAEWANMGRCHGFWEAEKGPFVVNNAFVIEFCPASCGVCDIHLDARDFSLNMGFPQTAPDIEEPFLVQRLKAKVQETREYIQTLPEHLKPFCKFGHINCARMALSEECGKYPDHELFKYLCASACQTCELFDNNTAEQLELKKHYDLAMEDYKGYLQRQLEKQRGATDEDYYMM